MRSTTAAEVLRLELVGLERLGGSRHPADLLQVLDLEVAKPLCRQGRPDAGVEEGRLERLGQVVERTHLDAAHHARGVLEAGDDDDRQLAQDRVGLDLGQRLEPVLARHQHVEQDEVEGACSQRLHRVDPVDHRVDVVATDLERPT